MASKRLSAEGHLLKGSWQGIDPTWKDVGNCKAQTTVTNIRHRLLGLLRQAIYGRLAGYEDVNDAERLARDPATRAIVGREGMDRLAPSPSEMGRFETEWLASEANLAALTDLSGTWIDRVHERRPPADVILDMDSSESPTHGTQEGS